MKVAIVLLITLLGSTFGLPSAARFYDKDGKFLAPGGPVRRECIHEVESGSSVFHKESGETVVISPNGLMKVISPCNTPKSEDPFPSYYDGWLAYTTYQAPSDIDSFLGYFSVPNAPTNDPVVLYLFTGLQNVDWIPKVDPIPPVFDIIQPVLQYPGDNGDYWSVKSWYVTLTGDVLVTSEIKVNVGDNIFGNMTRVGPTSWYIAGVSPDQRTAGLTVTRSVLASQPWAYNTLECYGCTDCSYEPTTPVQFTSLAINYKGNSLNPKWVPYTSPNPKCHEKAKVNSPTSVTITFQ